MFGVPAAHAFVALMAQVLNWPSKMASSSALKGLLPDATLANITLLKQGGLP